MFVVCFGFEGRMSETYEWKEEVQQELGEEMKVNHGLYIFCESSRAMPWIRTIDPSTLVRR
jgi:hypothetical protein